MCLGATYQVMGKGGERRVAAREFYQGAYFTSLEAGDVLTSPMASGQNNLSVPLKIKV